MRVVLARTGPVVVALIAAASLGATSATRPVGVTTRPARAAATRPASAPSDPASKTIAFPFFEQTVSGGFVAFPDAYRGKLVLIHFWATWCPHSRKELAFWKEAYRKYHDRGLEIIGISTDQNHKRTADQVRQFLTQNDMAWEQVYDNATRLSQIYQVDTLPTSLLVDGTTGEVLERGQSLRRGGLAQHIETALRTRAYNSLSTRPSS